jgi:hypothetical protein
VWQASSIANHSGALEASAFGGCSASPIWEMRIRGSKLSFRRCAAREGTMNDPRDIRPFVDFERHEQQVS